MDKKGSRQSHRKKGYYEHTIDVIQSFMSPFPCLNGKPREALYYCYQETFLMTILKTILKSLSLASL